MELNKFEGINQELWPCDRRKRCDGSVVITPSTVTAERLFAPGLNGWLKACCHWAAEQSVGASPDSHPCQTHAFLSQLLPGLRGPVPEIARLHLDCAAVAACASRQGTPGLGKAVERIYPGPGTNPGGRPGRGGRSWVASSADPADIAEAALRQAAKNSQRKTRAAHGFTWHLWQEGFVCDLVRSMLGKQEHGFTTRVLFAVVNQNTGEALPAEFCFEVRPTGDGQVFIAPEQAFVQFKDSFEEIFDGVPAAVRNSICADDSSRALHDVRVSIHQVSVSAAEEGSAIERKWLNLDVLSGPSGTGAAGRGLHYAWLNWVDDGRVVVLAAVNRHGQMAEVEHIGRKVEALCDLLKGGSATHSIFDTIAVVGSRNASEAKAVVALREADVAVVELGQETHP